MKKKNRSKKALQKRRERIFIGVVIALLVLGIALAIVHFVTGGNQTTYTITEDGHVHAEDGTHIGTVEELFGITTASEATPAETAEGGAE